MKSSRMARNGVGAALAVFALAALSLFLVGLPTAQAQEEELPKLNIDSLAVEQTGQQEVTLTWEQADDSSITKYRYCAIPLGDLNCNAHWHDVPGSGPDTAEYVVTEGLGYTTYVFQIRAVNSAGVTTAYQRSLDIAALPELIVTPGNEVTVAEGGTAPSRWRRIPGGGCGVIRPSR